MSWHRFVAPVGIDGGGKLFLAPNWCGAYTVDFQVARPGVPKLHVDRSHPETWLSQLLRPGPADQIAPGVHRKPGMPNDLSTHAEVRNRHDLPTLQHTGQMNDVPIIRATPYRLAGNLRDVEWQDG